MVVILFFMFILNHCVVTVHFLQPFLQLLSKAVRLWEVIGAFHTCWKPATGSSKFVLREVVTGLPYHSS